MLDKFNDKYLKETSSLEEKDRKFFDQIKAVAQPLINEIGNLEEKLESYKKDHSQKALHDLFKIIVEEYTQVDKSIDDLDRLEYVVIQGELKSLHQK